MKKNVKKGSFTIHYQDSHGNLRGAIEAITEELKKQSPGRAPSLSEIGRELLIPAMKKRLRELKLGEKKFFNQTKN